MFQQVVLGAGAKAVIEGTSDGMLAEIKSEKKKNW